MDASQLTQLSNRQILSLLLAIICDLARRLAEPMVLAADIGDIDVTPTVGDLGSIEDQPNCLRRCSKQTDCVVLDLLFFMEPI